ncbi:MAG: GAF domain-containing protein, partial [Candidatus Eisenbacteria bacterium]
MRHVTPEPISPDTSAPPASDSALPRISALSLLGPEGVAGPTHFLDLLQAASRQCQRLVGCERVRIWVSRRGGRRLVAWDFREDGGAPTERRLMKGEGLAGHVMRNELTLRLAEGDERPVDLSGELEVFRSALVIPLLRRGDPFGAIECLDKQQGDFTDADFDRLEVAAESVSLALDHALLSQEIERRALEKGVLLDITRALSAPLDLEEVIEAIFASLRQVVDYDAAAIYLVNRDTRVLEMVSAAGYPDGTDEAFALQIGQGVIGWVVKHGEGLIVPNVTEDRRYVAARPDTRSEIAAPLMLEGRTI